MRYAIVILLTIVLGIGVWYVRFFHTPKFPSGESSSSSGQTPSPTERLTILAENLDTPWSLAFLPNGNIILAERPGRVRVIENGTLSPSPLVELSAVKEIGEGGLLGIAVDPQFSENKFVYLYYTYDGNGSTLTNRIVRMTYEENRLSNEKILVDAIPSSANHDGGRIAFGPDSYLYATTGDAEEPSQAQDRNTLNGKILRVTSDGAAAPGNPYSNLLYSYGHRNPQGIAWDDKGNLWATEHGRSGIASGFDEINLIRAGYNYGWPTIQGNEIRTGMETPKAHSGSSTTWAPSGVAFIQGSLFFGGLRGQALYEAVIDKTNVTVVKTHLQGEFGRIRDVVVGPDKMLYITTSNNDGRGSPVTGDDKVIKIDPQKL